MKRAEFKERDKGLIKAVLIISSEKMTVIQIRTSFDIQSLLLFKFISESSKQISQSFTLCILMRRITCTTESIFPKKDVHAFLVLHIQL